jgi:hypothetical protein
VFGPEQMLPMVRAQVAPEPDQGFSVNLFDFCAKIVYVLAGG